MDEYFEVYDVNGKTSTVKKKGDGLLDGQYRMAAVAWIYNDGKFLIQKRAKNLRTYPGKWSATSGKSVLGEDPLDTVTREVNEELGTNFSRMDFIAISKEFVGSFCIFVFISFKNININTLVLQPTEVEEVQWKSVPEIEELMKNDEFFVNIAGWDAAKEWLSKKL